MIRSLGRDAQGGAAKIIARGGPVAWRVFDDPERRDAVSLEGTVGVPWARTLR